MWELASNTQEIHLLLEESDRYVATKCSPAPKRSYQRTQELVTAGAVRVWRDGKGVVVAMFTLINQAPFDLTRAIFFEASKPLYICRMSLADSERESGSLLGLKCIRHAMEVAKMESHDVLRAELNADVAGVVQLYEMLGFNILKAEQNSLNTVCAERLIHV